MGSFRSDLFSAVTPDIQRATEWLTELGINWKATRIRSYVHLHQRFADGSAQERNAILHKDRIAIYNATLEVDDLLRLHKSFAGKFDDLIQARMRTFVGGPERYSLERVATATNRARNIGFELRLLASLIDAGLDPLFESPADASGILEGRTLHFECKRPQSPRTLPSLIREAGKQLERTLCASACARARGIVALDTTKIGNPSLTLRRYDNRDQMAKQFDERCNLIGDHLQRLTPISLDHRVIGTFVIHREIAIIPTRDGPDPYTCESHILVTHPECSLLDSRLLRSFLTRLAPRP